MDKDSVEILKELLMRTMNGVETVQTELTRINTTLNESILSDNKMLKERANRHRRDIDELESRVKSLENSKRYTTRILIFFRFSYNNFYHTYNCYYCIFLLIER